MVSPNRLCPSCAGLTLPALLQAIPIPRRPKGGGSGVPNFFEYSTPQPLSFPLKKDEASCSLCSLILYQEATAKTLSTTSAIRPLQLRGLVPPTQHGHRTSYVKDVGHTFDQFG